MSKPIFTTAVPRITEWKGTRYVLYRNRNEKLMAFPILTKEEEEKMINGVRELLDKIANSNWKFKK